jgi:hypothetical protein
VFRGVTTGGYDTPLLCVEMETFSGKSTKFVKVRVKKFVVIFGKNFSDF